MRCDASIVLETTAADEIYRALACEMDDELHRGVVDLQRGDGQVEIRIEGRDLASARAALNTWIRLLKIGWEMMNI
ncbi:MAG: hypothetical protein JW986_07615 [Methanotrichaceae archaeon]|nr:hypothetical protein [Methanotrichaceae archaeon]